MVQLADFGKERMSKVAARAKRLGMTPARYVQHLVDEDLAISRDAKKKTFAEIMGPGREADEREIDALVEKAIAKYHRRIRAART
jgi:ABC-type uncharacterized transport system ATPase subunit